MSSHRYVTSVSSNGRYFTDQHGDPLLVFGDSPWAGPVRWSPEQAELYFADREADGFNASIMSLIGSRTNGGPNDDGTTDDGIRPFVDGDVLRWNEAYWQRMDDIVRSACAHGNTLFLYPIDGWNIQQVFRNISPEQARRYGEQVAERYARFPNIVWMTGGDYFPGDYSQGNWPVNSDDLLDQMLAGIRSTGDVRPFSVQLGYLKSLSTDSPYWEPRVDWNFVYTYLPTYRAVLDGYHRSGGRDPRPALLGESNYERENNVPGSPDTTNESLRRQMLWAVTSGSPGYFYGSADWQFPPQWEERLDTPAVTQLHGLAAVFGALRWWDLVPDETSTLVTAGRGDEVLDDTQLDVLENDYATAARTPDGSLSVVYVPTQRTLTLDTSRLPASWTATWVDPARPDGAAVDAAVAPDGSVSTPGANADGNTDWLLLIKARTR